MRIFRQDDHPSGAGDLDTRQDANLPVTTEDAEGPDTDPGDVEVSAPPLSMKNLESMMQPGADLSLMIPGAPGSQQDQEIDLVAVQKKLVQMRTVQEMAVGFTLPHDWMYEKGKPYLTAPGAERVRMGFGVTVRDFWISPKIPFEDEYGPGYRYECSLIVWHPQIGWMPGLAVCSTRHKLWKRKKDDGGHYYLPASSIPETEVKHTVISWAIRDGIGRLFGLRNLTREDLERLGKGKHQAMGEVMREKKAGPGGASQPGQRSHGREAGRKAGAGSRPGAGDREHAGSPGEQKSTGAGIAPDGTVDTRG
jgi:hypothetical protein